MEGKFYSLSLNSRSRNSPVRSKIKVPPLRLLVVPGYIILLRHAMYLILVLVVL